MIISFIRLSGFVCLGFFFEGGVDHSDRVWWPYNNNKKWFLFPSIYRKNINMQLLIDRKTDIPKKEEIQRIQEMLLEYGIYFPLNLQVLLVNRQLCNKTISKDTVRLEYLNWMGLSLNWTILHKSEFPKMTHDYQ